MLNNVSKFKCCYLSVFDLVAPAVSVIDSDPPDTQLGCSAIDALHESNHATIKLILKTITTHNKKTINHRTYNHVYLGD